MADTDAVIPGGELTPQAHLHRITPRDLGDALRAGLADFAAKPSHYGFVVVVYPIIGLTLVAWAARGEALHLIYPLVTGFALIGPVAALGLYEISRRREYGLPAEWGHAFAVRHNPALGAVAAAGLMLAVIFLAWLYVAQVIYAATLGGTRPETLVALLREVLTTGPGWTLLLVGNAVGALFAVLALSVSVVTFPFLLDRGGSAPLAIATSMRAVATNPGPMLLWGAIVAGLLFLGALPGLVGLIVVLPILGHATWHLYRKVVADAPVPRRPAEM